MTDDARVHHLDHRVAELFRGDRSGVLARLDGHKELQVAGSTSAGEAACGRGGRHYADAHRHQDRSAQALEQCLWHGKLLFDQPIKNGGQIEFSGRPVAAGRTTGRQLCGSIVARVAGERRADGRIGVRANVLAVDEHVVRRVGAVLLGGGERARGGADDEGDCECGFGEHDHLLRGCRLHLIRCARAFGSYVRAGKSAPGPAASRFAQRVWVRNQLDNKGLLQRPAAGRGGSIGPGNEVSKVAWSRISSEINARKRSMRRLDRAAIVVGRAH
jgi:hypothetical protein